SLRQGDLVGVIVSWQWRERHLTGRHGTVRRNEGDRLIGQDRLSGHRAVPSGKRLDPAGEPVWRHLNPARRRSAEWHGQTLKPRARSCSRPSSVIFSGPHGGIHTQLMRKSLTSPSSATWVWSSITSVSGQAALVSVMSTVATRSASRLTP